MAKFILGALIILILGIFIVPSDFVLIYLIIIVLVFVGIIFYALNKDKLKKMGEKTERSERSPSKEKISNKTKEKSKSKVVIKELTKEEKKARKDELFEQRRQYVSRLKEADSQLMKNKLSQKEFEKISRESNSKIISIDAELRLIDSGLPKSELNQLKDVSEETRQKLKDLLDEKQKKINELKLAEQNYLKRRISENTYKKISGEIRSAIITINSKINTLKNSNNITELKARLKEEAVEVNKQSAENKEKQKEVVEFDILKQLGLK